MRVYLNKILYLSVVVALFYAAACSRDQKAQEAAASSVVATVNGEPILLTDLQAELTDSGRGKTSGEITQAELDERLGALVDRKLMAQAAVKLGIEKDEMFRQKLKTFREQTLADEFLAAKAKETADALTVSDDETKALHSRMRYKIYVRQAHRTDRQKAELVLKLMRKGKRVKGMKKIGPLFAERVGISDPLYNAFDIKQGEGAIWPEPDGYRIVVVTMKKKLPLPPLKSVRKETETYLIEKKKLLSHKAWLDELKKGALIEVKTDEFEKFKSLNPIP